MIMKRRIAYIFFLNLFFFNVLAQQNIQKEGNGVNLSLWKNVATQRTDTVGSTWLNIGIFSAMNRVNGLSVNVLSSSVRQNTNGIQIAGISNIVGESIKGLQLAGITNIIGDDLHGIGISGMVSIVGNDINGFSFAGLTNIAGDRSRGLMLGGLLNISGKESKGLQISGMSNINGEDMKGVLFSGLLNMVGKEMHGVQVSALGNIVGEELKGMQLGVANVALRAKGLQIGLVNYYRESLDGFQLGLVNANPQTRIQLMLFGGNATKMNLGVRFKNELFYTILGGGTHYLDFSDKFSASFFYRAGMELPLYKERWFVSGDLGFQHIETFKNKHLGIPARLYALQARLNLEYHPKNLFGLFATVGYGGSRHYNRNITFDKGIILEAGIIKEL